LNPEAEGGTKFCVVRNPQEHTARKAIDSHLLYRLRSETACARRQAGHSHLSNCGAEWFHPETLELSDVEFRCSFTGARFKRHIRQAIAAPHIHKSDHQKGRERDSALDQ
jgi:hypothetical protein